MCLFFINLSRSHDLTCIFDMLTQVDLSHFFCSFTFDFAVILTLLFFFGFFSNFFSRLP